MQFTLRVIEGEKTHAVQVKLEPTKEVDVFKVFINNIDIQEELVFLGFEYDYTKEFQRIGEKFIRNMRWMKHLSDNYVLNLSNIEL